MNADASLARNTAVPTISPDGRWVAYVSNNGVVANPDSSFFNAGNGTNTYLYDTQFATFFPSEPLYNNNKQGEDVANGFVYASYDPANGTLVKTNYTAFPEAFIAELTGKTVHEPGKLYTFTIRKVLLRNDGGASPCRP